MSARTESCGWWDRSGASRVEWASEGELKRRSAIVGKTETALRDQGSAYDSTHREDVKAYVKQGGTAGNVPVPAFYEECQDGFFISCFYFWHSSCL